MPAPHVHLSLTIWIGKMSSLAEDWLEGGAIPVFVG
jgi:hypothetical protein